MAEYSFVSVNGQVLHAKEKASLSIWDTSLHRGDGVFETMRLLPRSCGEIVRGLDEHVERLEMSAKVLACPLPPAETIRNWLMQAAEAAVDSHVKVEEGGPGSLKLLATKGNTNKGIAPKVIIMWIPLPAWSTSYTLYPLLAPWHSAGAPGWERAIKWTSCGPNTVSTQKAQAAGYTDALLLSCLRLRNKHLDFDRTDTENINAVLGECHVLDGPSFAVSWVKDATLYVPDSRALGLLPSITQALVKQWCTSELGMLVNPGIHSLRNILAADECFVLSTTRGIIPITNIGGHVFSEARPVTKRLQILFAKECGVYEPSIELE